MCEHFLLSIFYHPVVPSLLPFADNGLNFVCNIVTINRGTLNLGDIDNDGISLRDERNQFMMDVALVEDDQALAEIEKTYIRNSWKPKEELRVEVYENAERFLKRVQEGKHFDLLIADIELPGMNGIEMGKLLKSFDGKTAVIFLTAHSGFALESYQIDAEQYILKSEMKIRLPEVLNRIGARILQNRKRCRFILEEGQLRRIDYEDVLYFFKEGKYVIYVMQDGTAKERINLENALKETGGFPFVKVERGYVVNARYVRKITEDRVFMMNQDEVPVSRRMLPAVRREIVLNRSRV